MTEPTEPTEPTNLGNLFTGIAEAFSNTADLVAAKARNATDPAEATRLRNVASTGHRLARATTAVGARVAAAEKKITADAAAETDRMQTLIRESRIRSGLREVDPISETAPVGTQYRRIVAGNLVADIGKLGVDRVCGARTNDAYCVLKEGHMPPRYDEDQPYHADAEQAARARRYLIRSDPDPEQRP
jgi:hypothetical protein